jgi:hypothetical protein
VRLADVYSHMGRYGEALEGYERARSILLRPASHRSRSARTYAVMGRTHEARALLTRSPVPAQAAVHVALGEHEAAFALLNRGIDTREDWPLFVKADPDFDSLRADPRWTRLLERMHLSAN